MIPQIPTEFYRGITELCRKYRVRELSLFGSRSRGDFTPDSDYDFLVDFLPEAHISLFQYAGFQVDLEDLLGKKVDLIQKDGLKPRIKDRILSEARSVYAG